MELSPWLIWFVVGLGLMLAELAVPAFVIMFFGLGCVLTAPVAYFVPGELAVQIGVFAASSLASLILLRRQFMKIFTGDSVVPDAGLTEDLAGQVVEVVEAIEPGVPGRVKYRGSFWSAVSDSAVAQGAKVRIVSADSRNKSLLHVEPV